MNTLKSRAEARVTIQEIVSLGVLQTETSTKQDVFLFINSKILEFEVTYVP